MAFGLNRVELIGRLGAYVTVNHLTSGGRVANLSIATDESYINRQTGDKVDKTEWHRVVTFQDGLIDMFVKHAVKGRLVYIDGKLQTRRWSKPGEDGDRFSTGAALLAATAATAGAATLMNISVIANAGIVDANGNGIRNISSSLSVA